MLAWAWVEDTDATASHPRPWARRMAITALGFDIFARDHVSETTKKVGRSAKQLAIDVQAANVRVEKATRSLALAETKFGKSSLEARDASVKLGQAQLRLNNSTRLSGETAHKTTGHFRNLLAAVGGLAITEGLFEFEIGRAHV